MGRPVGGRGYDDFPDVDEHPKTKLPRYLKILVIIGSVLMIISGGTLALVYGLSSRYQADEENILDGVPQGAGNIGEGPLNILVLGTDSRADEQTEQLDSTGSNSDTIILVHVSKGLQRAFMVSIPRDSYVNVPAGGSWDGGKEKINSAFRYGGANLAAKAVYELTKIPLDGAMIVNFAGVRNMVEAVGGVHVCVPYAVPNFFQEYPQYPGWSAGCHDMQGEETEVFVRQRNDVPGGDFGRMRSQQLVMKALAEKATSAGILTNPGKLDALLLAATRSLTIDQNMDLRGLAFALKGISPDNIDFATLPHTGTGPTEAGSSVFLDEPGCEELFQAIRDDKAREWLAAHPQEEIPTY